MSKKSSRHTPNSLTAIDSSRFPPGYPVGVHLAGVKAFGTLQRYTDDGFVWLDIKGTPVCVPERSLSTAAQSFSLVLEFNDGLFRPFVFEHRQEALGFASGAPADRVGPVPVDAVVARALLSRFAAESDPAHGAAVPARQAAQANTSAPNLVRATTSRALENAFFIDRTMFAGERPGVLVVHVHGAALESSGRPGGWAFVCDTPTGHRLQVSGNQAETTKNRMELAAAVHALQHVQDVGSPDAVVLWSDSEYLRSGLTKWLAGWKARGWKKADGGSVANQDLWQTLDALIAAVHEELTLDWHWVGAQDAHEGDDRAKQLATQAASNVETKDK